MRKLISRLGRKIGEIDNTDKFSFVGLTLRKSL